jgi:hypothetical protein
MRREWGSAQPSRATSPSSSQQVARPGRPTTPPLQAPELALHVRHLSQEESPKSDSRGRSA